MVPIEDLTVKTLARLLNVPETKIYKLLSGKAIPDGVLQQLAKEVANETETNGTPSPNICPVCGGTIRAGIESRVAKDQLLDRAL